jgi:hypothetical protein
MPNQRSETKKLISAFTDESIKKAIQATGISETEFIELAIVRGLIRDKRLTKSQVAEMARAGRIKAYTMSELRRDGFIKG